LIILLLFCIIAVTVLNFYISLHISGCQNYYCYTYVLFYVNSTAVLLGPSLRILRFGFIYFFLLYWLYIVMKSTLSPSPWFCVCGAFRHMYLGVGRLPLVYILLIIVLRKFVECSQIGRRTSGSTVRVCSTSMYYCINLYSIYILYTTIIFMYRINSYR